MVTRRRLDVTVFLFYVVACAYFFACLNRISAGVVMPYLAERQGFSATMVGVLSSLYFYSYGFSQNLWGVVNDRVGPMRACAAGLLLAAGGLLVATLSPQPLCVGLSRIITGLGYGSVFTGIYLYAAIAFPPEHYPFWVGVFQVVGNLGTVVAVAPIGWLLDRVGYRGLSFILAALALSMASLLWVLREKAPPLPVQAGEDRRGMVEKIASIARDMAFVMKLSARDARLRTAMLVWCTSCAGLQTLQGLWGVSWISASSGVDVGSARFWTTMISVGLVVGSPLGPAVTRAIGGNSRRLAAVMAVLGIFWAFYMCASMLGKSAPWMGAAGFLIGLLSAAIFVFCGSTIKALAPVGRAGAVIGAANMMIFALLIVFQSLSGFVIDLFPSAVPGLYLNSGFLIGFVPVVLSILAATASVLTVPTFRPDHP